MPQIDPIADEESGPPSHRAPRPGLAKRWAVGAAGVAVLAVGLLISPALGTDGEPAPAPTPTPTASPSTTPKATPEATPKATTTSRASADPAPATAAPVKDAVVVKRMDDALEVVRKKSDTVSGADTKVERDDSGTITIITKPAETYTGSEEDLVSSLLGAIQADIDVDVVPAAPGLRATLDLQPIAITLGLG